MMQPTPGPAPIGSIQSCTGFVGTTWGDPHIVTFDGVKYDCQGDGDFILVESSLLQVQARFVTLPVRPNVSLTRAVAIAGDDSGVLQFEFVQESSEASLTIGRCGISVLANGQQSNALMMGSLVLDNSIVTMAGATIAVRYPRTGVSVFLEITNSGSFGCFFNVYVCLPDTLSDAVGLLGTPNGVTADDWTDRTQNAVALPTGRDLLFESAYTFCTTSWCIVDPDDSIFTYDQDSQFSDIENCGAPYPGSVDMDSVSQELKDLCGSNLACLVEGAAGTLEDAREALRVDQALQDVGNCLNIMALYYEVVGNINTMPDFETLTPYLTETVTDINYPSEIGGRSTYIAAVFNANLVFPSTGTWTLCLESDNGSRLFLDNQEVIAVIGIGRGCHIMSIDSVDESFGIQITFWQTFGPMHLRFLWSGPSVPEESIVPSCAFQPPEVAAPPPVLLYRNDFESPQSFSKRSSCSDAVAGNNINEAYGSEEFQFAQQFTVEVTETDCEWMPGVFYTDPTGRGGNFSISMLSTARNDLLGLTFDAGEKAYINIGMDVSSIDLNVRGGPFGISDPVFQVRLIDSPSGQVNLQGTVLDSAEATGSVAPNQWTFAWTYNVISLSTSGSTNGKVSVVWDLLQSGYGAFDNLVVAASDIPGDLPS